MIQAEPEGSGQVAVSVTDGGDGVSPEIRERLFSPFVSSKCDGMGIGLSLCRSIIDDHGGKVVLEPDSTQTTFRFWLPAGPATVS